MVGIAVNVHGAGASREGQLEARLQAHSGLVAAAILALGFSLRLHAASGTFLNPDEALHFLTANQLSLAAVYRESLNTAHPPLLMFVLHFWRHLGTSEFVLRVPSVLAGTGFCWFFYAWVNELFGKVAGIASLALAALLPPMIELSSEIRQYALLLLFLSACVYFVERALTRSSAPAMLLGWIFLDLALLAHYAAAFVSIALGVYCILRNQARRRVLAAAITGAASAAALVFFLYRTHIARMAGTLQLAAQEWMRTSYYHPGHGSAVLFAFARTVGVLQFIFGQLVVGDLLFLLFAAGIAFLFWKPKDQRPLASSNLKPSWQLGLLFVLPFVLNCAAAIAGKYPYGGTRHCAYLAIFAIAAVSYALAKLLSGRLARALGTALLIVIVCSLFGHPHRPYMLRRDQNERNMRMAIAAIRLQVPSEATLFIDSQTGFLLRYYLCRDAPFTDASVLTLRSYQCGGYRVISAPTATYTFTAENFPKQLRQMAQTYKPSDAIWVFQAGWDVKLPGELQSLSQFHDLQPQWFGRNIVLFQISGSKNIITNGP